MARRCSISKKGGLVGNNVSHSKRRTKMKQELNLQWKRFWQPEKKKWVRLRVTTRMIKTITRKGFMAVLKKNKISV